MSKKLRRIFSKHDIPVQFKPSFNTLRQQLVHRKDKIYKHKLSHVYVDAVQRKTNLKTLMYTFLTFLTEKTDGLREE